MEETQSPAQLCWQLVPCRNRAHKRRLPSCPRAVVVPASSMLVTTAAPPRFPPQLQVLCCRWWGRPAERSLCHHTPGSATQTVIPSTHLRAQHREHAVAVPSKAPCHRSSPRVGSCTDQLVVARGPGWSIVFGKWLCTVLSAQWASAPPLYQEVVPGPLSNYSAIAKPCSCRIWQ